MCPKLLRKENLLQKVKWLRNAIRLREVIQQRCEAIRRWRTAIRLPKAKPAHAASPLRRTTRLRTAIRVVGGSIILGGVFIVGGYIYLSLRLPSVEILQNIQLQVPLRVYTRDGRLLAEFGKKRRVPVLLDQIPETLILAILATEDERFYTHPGVDWRGLVRAVVYLIRTGEKGPGGSTITMQVARNFFLGREKTYERKINEILLALKIERELTKEDILSLYLNKVFLGHRAYGFGAAAQVYYAKELQQLDLAQLTMIAGLPKAPSRYNPIANPERAVTRRNYVLRRMLKLGFIDVNAYDQARNAPVTASVHSLVVQTEAPYVAEMVRAQIKSIYGPHAYTVGLKVYTTIESRMQTVANAALREALLTYDRRHGYRGAIRTLPEAPDNRRINKILAGMPVVGGLRPAIVLDADDDFATVYAKDFGIIDLSLAVMKWAKPYKDKNHRGPEPRSVRDIVQPGAVIRVRLTEDGWHLAQIPEVEGALVALSADDGAILALVGGFDFYHSKFNRAVQAKRQPGSSFKPFIYSAAIKKGYTAATLINDAPVVVDDPSLPDAWRPENYSGKFFGPTRMREAFYRSRNLVSIRLLQAIGIPYAVEHIGHFGFDIDRLPKNLSLALGSGEVTPLELASGYAVLANGGYRVAPHFIDKVLGPDDSVVYTVDTRVVCPSSCTRALAAQIQNRIASGESNSIAEPPMITINDRQRRIGDIRIAERVLDADNAWIVNSMMRDVIKLGTGRKARVLKRSDLAGKTGTTNDQRDAWFSGFNRRIVATAWVGFDRFNPLGRQETGGRAALPMWIAFMREAMRGTPEEIMERPESVVTARIDPTTGKLANANAANAIFETFRTAYAPKPGIDQEPPQNSAETEAKEDSEQLF